jgi:hypothetical protein
VLQLVAHSVSSVLSQQILQHNIVQHRVRQQALQFAVLIFKRFKAMGLRHIHATVFEFELVEQRWTKAMPAAHLCSPHPSFLLLNQPNNLCLKKTALSYLFAPSKGWTNSTSKCGRFREAGHALVNWLIMCSRMADEYDERFDYYDRLIDLLMMLIPTSFQSQGIVDVCGETFINDLITDEINRLHDEVLDADYSDLDIDQTENTPSV